MAEGVAMIMGGVHNRGMEENNRYEVEYSDTSHHWHIWDHQEFCYVQENTEQGRSRRREFQRRIEAEQWISLHLN